MARRWIGEQHRLDAFVEELAGAEAYALDTEFHRERSYFPKLALVQLAWRGGAVLVDALAVDLRPLARVLDGPGLAVVHAAEQDLEVLQRACGTIPSRLFDTQLAAGLLGFSSPSLSSAVERLLGRRLVKGDRLTDWTRRPLTADQQAYASSDVEHLLELRTVIASRLEARGRLAWAEEECEALRSRARSPQDPETAWWRLKDARQLRGAARGVAQEVMAWRERRAAELDVPPRFVLPDLAVSSIAQRPPRNGRELSDVRGLDGRHLHGDTPGQVLAAVERGRDLPDAQLRRTPAEELDRGLRPAVALVSAWVAHLAAALDVDLALLATRADLQSFLRGDPGARLATGWRHELVGEPIRQLVDGRAAVALENARLVLEARSHEALTRRTAAEGPTDPA
ncbi:MAG: HRDC domain-containing protein [Actinomycetota bacterium]|nr:HRDC domain-containing protein [Actinomycetota bacterium]